MKWTPEKIEELRRRYPHEDNGQLAKDLGCSRKAIETRASFCGILKAATRARRTAAKARAGRDTATGFLTVDGNVTTHKLRG